MQTRRPLTWKHSDFCKNETNYKTIYWWVRKIFIGKKEGRPKAWGLVPLLTSNRWRFPGSFWSENRLSKQWIDFPPWDIKSRSQLGDMHYLRILAKRHAVKMAMWNLASRFLSVAAKESPGRWVWQQGASCQSRGRKKSRKSAVKKPGPVATKLQVSLHGPGLTMLINTTG